MEECIFRISILLGILFDERFADKVWLTQFIKRFNL